jgi:ATP/maltotriose-dependent transcriptional regulator MalT
VYTEAKTLLADALMVSQECNFQIATAFCMNVLGLLAVNLGDYEDSMRCYKESYKLARDGGSRNFIAYGLQGISRAAFMLCDYAEAARLAQESLTIFRQSGGDQVGSIYGNTYLGASLCRLQQYEDARHHFCNALQTAARVEAITVFLYSMAWMAELLAAEGQRDQAVAVLAITLHHSLSWMETRDQARRVLAQLEPELPPLVAAGIREGWNVDDFFVEELAVALEVTPESIARLLLPGLKPPIHIQANSRSNSGRLNEREVEILGLIAEGFTNREIAAQLVFSINTVKWYMKDIFSKLHVSSRTHAVARARTLGLLP